MYRTIILVVISLCIIGCTKQSEQVVIDSQLRDEIIALEYELAELEAINEGLDDTISNLKNENNVLSKDIEAIKAELIEANIDESDWDDQEYLHLSKYSREFLWTQSLINYQNNNTDELWGTRLYALYNVDRIGIGTKIGDLSVAEFTYDKDGEEIEGYSIRFEGSLEVRGTIVETDGEFGGIKLQIDEADLFMIPSYYIHDGCYIDIRNLADISNTDELMNNAAIFVISDLTIETSEFSYTKYICDIDFIDFNRE